MTKLILQKIYCIDCCTFQLKGCKIFITNCMQAKTFVEMKLNDLNAQTL